MNGVFRKLPQPSLSLAAPHPRYSMLEDQRNRDIQVLLRAAVEVDFDKLLTYKIEYSDAIVKFEDSQEEYINAFSHLNKINSIVKIENNSIESFKNSLTLAKNNYDNKLNKLGDTRDLLNNLENKIFEIEQRLSRKTF